MSMCEDDNNGMSKDELYIEIRKFLKNLMLHAVIIVGTVLLCLLWEAWH
jgi:hypothetical protein